MKSTGSIFYDYLVNLKPKLRLPGNVTLINPYHQTEVRSVFKKFCESFYGNTNSRVLVLGINPGRFGAGITGIPFTDPVALSAYCGIANNFDEKRELSSRFVYDFITAFGGVEKFYNSFLLTAVCPLGFLHGTKNYNYYDSQDLLNASSKLIRESLLKFSTMNISNKVVISLGKKNATHLEKFNDELQLFGKIITLEHPRYIMQYKLKEKERYLDSYFEAFSRVP